MSRQWNVVRAWSRTTFKCRSRPPARGAPAGVGEASKCLGEPDGARVPSDTCARQVLDPRFVRAGVRKQDNGLSRTGLYSDHLVRQSAAVVHRTADHVLTANGG